jgi:hypothetical protein
MIVNKADAMAEIGRLTQRIEQLERKVLSASSCSPRLISLAEVRDAASQVKQDQSTWRNGSAAVVKMVDILTENCQS